MKIQTFLVFHGQRHDIQILFKPQHIYRYIMMMMMIIIMMMMIIIIIIIIIYIFLFCFRCKFEGRAIY